MADRIWISATDDRAEGSPAQKKVVEKNGEVENRSIDMLYTHISYKLPGIWKKEAPFDAADHVVFDLPEAGYMTRVGGPMLVQEGIFVEIPPNAVFENIEVSSDGGRVLEGEYQVLPVPEPVLETQKPEFMKDEKIYSSDDRYPGMLAEYVGEEEIMGIKCAHIYVYPIQYRTKDRKVEMFTDIEIKVYFKAGNQENDQDGFCSPVIQPLILGYEKGKRDSESKPRMLIITTGELKDSLKIYQGIKTFLYETEIVIAEDIYQCYPGKEQDEAILEYLISEHRKKPLSYVVLGGGIRSIPTHRDSEGFACDSYYCTDGSSVLPRFALSRIPADTKEEMNRQCDIASYYDRFYNSTRQRVIFTAYNDKAYIECKEDIAAGMKSGLEVVKCYDGDCSKEILMNTINKGAALINYRGHGNSVRWQSSNGLSSEDVGGLDVGKNTPIVLSIACSNNDLYHARCFGISWIKYYQAVSFLGASAPSYTYVNHSFDKFLWEAINSQKLSNIGDIYVWATLKLYQNDKSIYARKNIREYLLLGDVSADYLADDISHNQIKTEGGGRI